MDFLNVKKKYLAKYSYGTRLEKVTNFDFFYLNLLPADDIYYKRIG